MNLQRIRWASVAGFSFLRIEFSGPAVVNMILNFRVS